MTIDEVPIDYGGIHHDDYLFLRDTYFQLTDFIETYIDDLLFIYNVNNKQYVFDNIDSLDNWLWEKQKLADVYGLLSYFQLEDYVFIPYMKLIDTDNQLLNLIGYLIKDINVYIMNYKTTTIDDIL